MAIENRFLDLKKETVDVVISYQIPFHSITFIE